MTVIKLSPPIRLLAVGPSGAGKSCLVSKMIRNRNEVFDKPFSKIYYCAKFATSMPRELQGDKDVVFHQGCPDEQMLENKIGLNNGEHTLIILDDLGETAQNNDIVSMLFTQVWKMTIKAR